jgi:hypothetical protein
MTRTYIDASLAIVLLTIVTASAQRPSNAPATAPSGKPPDTVMLEDLTWAEVRDLRWHDHGDHWHRGARTEGPAHGRRRTQVRHGVSADKIARALGGTLRRRS